MSHPLALSVRIAEGFRSKEEAILPIEALAELAVDTGYDALCMRASQVGIHSPPDEVDRVARVLAEAALPVNMLTADFDIVYNNDQGPHCLRNVGPYLELAQRLSTSLIRVALKTEEDIAWAQRAADEAASVGITLAHQCHARSLFETVAGIEATLRAIDRENFRLIYEPANLELCGQPYGPATIQRLSPWIANVYLQNHVLREGGAWQLDTWCRGRVALDLLPIHAEGGIDFSPILAALEKVGYDGPITVHQAAGDDSTPHEAAQLTARFLKDLEQHLPRG